MGFEVENRPLQAHITLARARDGAPPTFAADLQQVIGDASIRNDLDSHRCDFSVRHVELIRSHLEKAGPRYETIARLSLSGAAR
jgi:2'-5' RNA ligase